MNDSAAIIDPLLLCVKRRSSLVRIKERMAYSLWPIACAEKTGLSLFVLYAISHTLAM
jgi:hypothetical protein